MACKRNYSGFDKVMNKVCNHTHWRKAHQQPLFLDQFLLDLVASVVSAASSGLRLESSIGILVRRLCIVLARRVCSCLSWLWLCRYHQSTSLLGIYIASSLLALTTGIPYLLKEHLHRSILRLRLSLCKPCPSSRLLQCRTHT